MESHVYKVIPVNQISKDFPFIARYRMRDAALSASVAQKGILDPLLISKQQEIVSGHKRLMAAQEAGLNKVPVLQICEDQEPGSLFLMAVLANWNRLLDPLDQVFIACQAVNNFQFSEKIILDEIFPAIGLKPERHFLEECLEAGRLDASVREAIDRGLLPFRGSRVLSRFSLKEQVVFTDRVAGRAALTSNQLLQAGEWLYDLMKLKKKTLAELLEASTLEEILQSDRSDRRQKGELFFARLREIRFPQLVQREKAFASLSEQIASDRFFSVQPPAFFEGEGFTLKVRIPNRKALEKFGLSLEEKRKLFNSLFDVML